MANELVITAGLNAILSGVRAQTTATGKTQSAAATALNVVGKTQEIAARAAVDVGSLDITLATGDEYIICMYNRSAAGIVTVELEYTTDTYVVVGTMRPGEPWGPVRMPKMTHANYGNLHITPSAGTMYVEVTAAEAGTPP